MAKSINDIAFEVLIGKWGAGKTRESKLKKAGYDYNKVQSRVNEIVALDNKICAWAKKTADSGKYKYKVFTDDVKTHQCPICHKLTGKYLGWNCIGFAWACWFHGGGLPCKCNCEVINDTTGEKIYNAKTDAEALKLVQSKCGLSDVKVIRNKKYIPQSELIAGDILLYFEGSKYTHMMLYVGNGKIADSSRGHTPQVKYGVAMRQKEVKVAIRYIGKTPKATPTKKGYSGKLPTLRLTKSNAKVKSDACKWAQWIAGDNRFHYGYGEQAHHNGCYFCGTQRLKKGHGIKNYERTYCCNPFVHASYAHGGGDATAYKMCHNTDSWDFNKGSGYDSSKLFDKLGHPAKSSLKAGDVLCNNNHVVLYIGGGKIAEASGGDDNVPNSKKWNNSIHVTELTDSRYKGLPRAYRYNGSVKANRPLSHGEVSDRTADLQKYLNWYYGTSALSEDGIFGDATLAAVKKFQKAEGLSADGWVGETTIAAMKKVKK